jgi:hypothetical protein
MVADVVIDPPEENPCAEHYRKKKAQQLSLLRSPSATTNAKERACYPPLPLLLRG